MMMTRYEQFAVAILVIVTALVAMVSTILTLEWSNVILTILFGYIAECVVLFAFRWWLDL